jgi:peptidoglycan/LPS O-acetylase OafA/YrhL
VEVTPGGAEATLATEAPPAAAVPERTAKAPRLLFLDGIRALAALYVVAHHMYITVYPTFPRNTGPWYLGWLLYGHFGVAVFIVVSGFSLSLAPARRGFELTGGIRRFISRRAWRIIPAYWAALAASVLITALVINLKIHDPVSFKAVVVNGLLLQDVIKNNTPNGAFWSIAVEWQIYFLFPIFLFARRRIGAAATAVAATAGVLVVYLAAVNVGPFHRLLDLSPQFVALFVFGIAAAGVVNRSDATDRREVPWGWISLSLAAVLVVIINKAGTQRITTDFYLVDIAVGVVVACALPALVRGGLARRALETKQLVKVGSYSYSVYLIHAPIIFVVWLFAIQPLGLSSGLALALYLPLGAVIVLICSYGFFLLFERPFLNRRAGTPLFPARWTERWRTLRGGASLPLDRQGDH